MASWAQVMRAMFFRSISGFRGFVEDGKGEKNPRQPVLTGVDIVDRTKCLTLRPVR